MRRGFTNSSVLLWRSFVRFNFFALVFSFGLVGSAVAEVPSMFEYQLGDHVIDYPTNSPDVIASELYSPDGQSFIKVAAPQKTELVLTFTRPDQTLKYLEHDWVDRDMPATTALNIPGVSEFVFGKTRVVDVQAALGQDGFYYDCRQLQSISGGVNSLVSFEIPSIPDAVYTFAFEFSQDLADRGLVDLDKPDLSQAILVAAIVSRPEYPETFWCSETSPYTDQPILPELPKVEVFEDFLPEGAGLEVEPWQVVSDPVLMIAKPGSITWGDRMFIIQDPKECTLVDIFVWSHTFDDRELLTLEGRDLDGSFNILTVGGQHVPIESPVNLSFTMYAPVVEGAWPPFAIGSFVFRGFDLTRLASMGADQSVFGFSLEFVGEPAGLRDNYWSLDGLSSASQELIQLCEVSQ